MYHQSVWLCWFAVRVGPKKVSKCHFAGHGGLTSPQNNKIIELEDSEEGDDPDDDSDDNDDDADAEEALGQEGRVIYNFCFFIYEISDEF